MTTDYRALCEELAGWIERSTRHYIQDPDVLIRARAALAAPPAEGEVAEGPTDEELTLVYASAVAAAVAAAVDNRRGPFSKEDAEAAQLAGLRAVLARYGHQPAPPAAGEVGVLLRELRDAAFDLNGSDPAKSMLTRAADLLEQRHPAPVPVSERLPWNELCWWFEADEDCGYGSNWTLLRIRGSATGYSHWLPATALPLPSGEVE